MAASEPSVEEGTEGAARLAAHDNHRKRRLVLTVTTSLFSLILALSVAEIALRFLTPLQLGFEYKDGRFTHPREHLADRTCNARGFHDVDHGPKRPGVRRVLLLGDSYVDARTVPIAEGVGQRLEQHLNARSEQTYEVVSMGRGCWGQRQQFFALGRTGIFLHPDVVITLFLSLNDVTDNYPPLDRRTWKQQVTHQHHRPGVTSVSADEAPLLLFRWSVLNQLISHRLTYLLCDRSVEAIPLAYFAYAQEEDDEWREAWRRTEQLFLETKRLLGRIGVRYVVVTASTPHGIWGADEGLKRLMAVYPGMKQLEWDLDKPDKRVARLCKDNNIPSLALEPLFRIETVEKGKRLHWRYEGHWNREGNDLAARYIADFLLGLEGSREFLDPQ